MKGLRTGLRPLFQLAKQRGCKHISARFTLPPASAASSVVLVSLLFRDKFLQVLFLLLAQLQKLLYLCWRQERFYLCVGGTYEFFKSL